MAPPLPVSLRRREEMMLPLTTPRLLLRRFRTEDLPSFSHYRNLPEVARFQSWTHYGMTEATAFYEQQRSQAFAEDESWFQLAVEIQANGALAGDVGIHFLDHGRQAELGMTFSPAYQHQGYAREAMRAVMALLFEQLAHHRLTAVVDTRNILDHGRQAELGMTFSPAYQHQGYAREAMRAVMALLFEQLAHHRLTAVVDTRNTGAIKLLEGLGFRREAHYRQNIFFKGEWGDEYLYALLRSGYQ
ncbi:GNAT family N-acetyltransferase [Klebsiella pneumoniae]|uniref:GNAT family N-acetyltransferase n=1 Tax=Klebsiella pneumoniae TaxID=573 RepID=UPI000A80BDDA|nr:GNAT family N-acetyltransferase [Klebsiella pneumoniae]HCI8755735.1 GNAT family N-acetyltransferase [Klebsiella pneumoniae]